MTLLERLQAQRKVKRDRLSEILGDETRTDDLTTDEDTEVGGLLADIAALDSRTADLGELESREAANEAVRRELGNTDTPGENVRVVSEPKVYTADSGNSWFGDAYRSKYLGDFNATGRLQRYAKENEVEKRDLATTAFGGLIPPQYLVDMFAPNLRSGRPTANVVTSMPLPATGMTFNIPRGTTKTTTAIQATQNSAVSETDFDETTLAVSLATIAGQQDISRQSLERASGNDVIIYADLSADYALQVDKQVLYGLGTGGEMLGLLATVGINAVTYTSAAPTVAEIYPKIADAIQRINSTRFLPATVIVMHPRRWGWFIAAVDSTGRPLVTPTAPQNPTGTGVAAEYGQVVGQIQGVPVVTDASIPLTYLADAATGGTQDVIVVMRASDCILWENGPAPMELRFEETLGGSLTVKLVVYGYNAFTAGRYPTGIATITGTGTAPPAF